MLKSYMSNTQNYYLQLEINNWTKTDLPQHISNTDQEWMPKKESKTPSHMKSSIVWINWNQIFSTTGKKTHDDIGRGQFKLSIFFHVCRQLILNSERTVEKRPCFVLFSRHMKEVYLFLQQTKNGLLGYNSSSWFSRGCHFSLSIRW